MSQEKWAELALESFDAVVASIPGFRVRESAKNGCPGGTDAGCRTAGQAGRRGSRASKSIAVVQAGTGVGKSLAYSAPAIAMALMRGTRVLISTATVALQEQLVNKDLPALAQQMPMPFKFALAKGRGRFVCKLKLERLASSGENSEEVDDLFAEEAAEQRRARPQAEKEARMQFYASMADALAAGEWNGDRDSLPNPPEAEA